MTIEIETAKVKSVRTVSKADEEGEVQHRTTVALEFVGLDMPSIEKLALAAHLNVPIDLAFEWPTFPTKDG